MNGKAVWICWERQRRNRELARALGIPLHEMGHLDSVRPRSWKYLRGLAATTLILLRKRPRLVVAMNPSIVLAAWCVTIGRLSPMRVVVDAHNSGLHPMEGRSRALSRLAGYVMRYADLVIVSNRGLVPIVESKGGRSVVLPDRLPDMGMGRPMDLPGTCNVVFICTFAADEPYRAVFAAAEQLPDDWVVHVTGNAARAGIELTNLPANVRLTGFLPEDDFVGLLRGADAVVDLTTREDCLVCGAYEAVSLGKVAILSDTEALRDYFGHVAVMTGHAPADLAAAMRQAVAERAEREAGMAEGRRALEARWAKEFANLEAELRRVCQPNCVNSRS